MIQESDVQQGVVTIMERIETENQQLSAQELKLDGSNKVSFPGYPYLFEALNEKILVSIDIFKSGYECKACMGKKRIKYECSCTKGPDPRVGFRFNVDQLNAIQESLGEGVADARKEQPCPECGGDPASVRRDEPCDVCKGRGALLVLPDSSKNLPTTGVVVSMGKKAQSEADFKIGDRVLFGPYSGSMIPTKAGLMFKQLDWNNVWCKIEGADEMASFDFIIQDSN